MSDPTPPPVALPPIDRDENMKRDYIPLPGGWEIQTKGKGSTFRIANSKTGTQYPILDDMAHKALVEMAMSVREAWNTRAALRPPETTGASADDAAVLAEYDRLMERGHNAQSLQSARVHYASADMIRAAVLSRMSKPEVGADDEALIRAFGLAAHKDAECKYETHPDLVPAEEALRRHIAGLRAIERTYRLIVEGWNKVVADKVAAESALAACRDKVIEECAVVAVSAVNRCREEGETDLRSVREEVNTAIRALKTKETQSNG